MEHQPIDSKDEVLGRDTTDLEAKLLALTLKVYNNPHVSSSAAQFFIEQFIQFTSETYTDHVKKEVIRRVAEVGDTDGTRQRFIETIFGSAEAIMNQFKTAEERFTWYQRVGFIIKPEKFLIGITILVKPLGIDTGSRENIVAGQYVSLKQSLKLLLEIPQLFQLIMDYMNCLKEEGEGIITDFTQGEYWKETSQEFGSLVLPLFIFKDEFELKSNVELKKLEVICAMLPFLPPKLALEVQNILPIALFYARDRKLFGNEKTFAKLIKELNELRHNGLEIIADGKTYTVHFQLCLILGVNSNINDLLGFGNHLPCRICRASVDEVMTFTKEYEKLIRTTVSYNRDIASNNACKTAIIEECAFNEVDGYHVCKNKVFDLVDDILDGPVNSTLSDICYDLIYTQKLFSLEFINQKLSDYPFGPIEDSKNIPKIEDEHLGMDNKLKMSALQLLYFIKHLGPMVGSKVKSDNKTWKLYILLRKIVSYITSPRTILGHILQLQDCVTQFLSLYIVWNGHLRDRFHNLVHIAHTIQHNGPLIHLWSMKYAQKLRHLNLETDITKANSLETLANESQLSLAYLKYNNLQYNKVIYDNADPIDENDRKMYFEGVDEQEIILSAREARKNGLQYNIDTILVINLPNNHKPVFGRIREIFIKSNNIYLIMQPLICTGFDEHRYAYRVKADDTRVLKGVEEIPEIEPSLLVEDDDKNLYVATRYIL